MTSTGRTNPLLPVEDESRSHLPWTSDAKEALLAGIGEGSAMDDDYCELAHRLFSAATAMLEDAIDLAVAGQSPRLDPSKLADHGRRLKAAAHDITIVAGAAVIAANLSANHPPSRRSRPR